VRTGLKRVVDRIADTSRHVYRFRGRRAAPGSITHAWERVLVRDGVNYVVNRHHPLVESLRDALDGQDAGLLDQLLRTMEMSLPTDSLYADMASERRVQTAEAGEEVEAFGAEEEQADPGEPGALASRRVVLKHVDGDAERSGAVLVYARRG
jgi:hypothetical protein